LITGGAGLIGSHLVDQLLQTPVTQVVVFDNFSRGRLQNLSAAAADARLTVIHGDVRDRAALAQAMAGVEVVFHQAAIRLTQCASEPRLALEVMVDGTYNVLEAALAAGARKVVAASSASVYGAASHFPTPEDHPLYGNHTLYGAAKAFNEMLLRSLHHMRGLDYVALRYFNVYGPRMDLYGAYTEVLVRWMARIAAGRPPLILGDGRQTLDLVYVEDVARANLLAAGAAETDTVFNVGSGHEISLAELAQALLAVMGSRLQPEFGPARAVADVPRRLADTRQAGERLGFAARVPLETGLRQLVDWWLAQGLSAQNLSAQDLSAEDLKAQDPGPLPKEATHDPAHSDHQTLAD
jgi:UDP-glucose 4-epimerase